MVRRSVQHSNIDTAVLVSGPFFVEPSDADLKGLVVFVWVGLFFPGTVALLSHRCSTMQGF